MTTPAVYQCCNLYVVLDFPRFWVSETKRVHQPSDFQSHCLIILSGCPCTPKCLIYLSYLETQRENVSKCPRVIDISCKVEEML